MTPRQRIEAQKQAAKAQKQVQRAKTLVKPKPAQPSIPTALDNHIARLKEDAELLDEIDSNIDVDNPSLNDFRHRLSDLVVADKLLDGFKSQIEQNGVHMQLPRADWPEGEKKFYRFVKSADDALLHWQRRKSAPLDKMSAWVQNDGLYKDSFRLTFDLPGIQNTRSRHEVNTQAGHKTIELLPSTDFERPSFGVVEVTLPLNIALVDKQTHAGERLVVTNISQAAALHSAIIPGDIVRAVSLPSTFRISQNNPQDTTPGFTYQGNNDYGTQQGKGPMFHAKDAKSREKMRYFDQMYQQEEGMAMLDETGVAGQAHMSQVMEFIRLNGKFQKVVLLVERPGSRTVECLMSEECFV